MYQKLLLNCAGGIINASKQYDQDNSAILAIGLGGTGVDCLRNLKAKVYNRIKPDDPNSPIKTYSHIKFLAVDTDGTGFDNANNTASALNKLNRETEFFDISYDGNMVALFAGLAATFPTSAAYKEWLEYDHIDNRNVRAGAGGIRQLGRYLFMEKANDFFNKVSNLINSAREGLNNPKVYVHIFSGISGGTGAGTFLDACYLVHHCLEQLNTNAFICGYFFLPDINLSQSLNDEVQAYVRANGYASMRELDYCINFHNNGDKWSQYYPVIGLVDSTKAPVDLCHLITARNANGNVIPNAYNHAMNVVTEYFMEFAAKTNAAGPTLESHIANYTNMKANVNKAFGASYEYSVLGSATATLPFKEVLTYLAAKLFENFEEIQNRVPSKQEFNTFVNENGLEYNVLRSKLTAGVNTAFPIPADVKWQDAKNDDGLTVTYFTNLKAAAEGRLGTNYTTLERNIDAYDNVGAGGEGALQSVVMGIFRSLRALMLDPSKGPYFAANILRNPLGGDLIAHFSGLIEEAHSLYNQELAQATNLKDEWERSQTIFFSNSTHFANGGRRYNAYRQRTREYILHQTNLIIFSKMVNLLESLRRHLINLSTNFTDNFRNVINKLMQTFAENRTYLNGLGVAIAAGGFEIPIANIGDLMPALDTYINTMNIDDKLSEFMNKMLEPEGINSWINGNENNIVNLVTSHFLGVFNYHAGKTMSIYLQEKYNSQDPVILADRIQSDIINNLNTRATPLFWTATGYNIGNAAKISYISVPQTCVDVIAAVNNFIANNANATKRETSITDRISFLNCLVGVPLFGYMGLLNYENHSVNNTTVGKYLYEGRNYTENGEARTGRNWKQLPSPIPFGRMNEATNQNLRNTARSASEIYARAEERGIIVADADIYKIKELTEGYLDQARQIYDGVRNGTIAQKQAAGLELRDLPKTYTNREYRLKNDAPATAPEENRRLVRIDHFALAPKYVDIVKKQLETLEQVDSWIAELSYVDTNLDDFLKAVFAGIIVIEGVAVTYTNDYTLEEIFLSRPGMAKAAVPIYQALATYRDFDNMTKGDIKEKTNRILNTYPVPENVTRSCQVVQNELNPAVIRNKINALIASYPEENGPVTRMYRDISDKLNTFKTTYGIL